MGDKAAGGEIAVNKLEGVTRVFDVVGHKCRVDYIERQETYVLKFIEKDGGEDEAVENRWRCRVS